MLGQDVTHKIIEAFHGTRDLLEFTELTNDPDRDNLKLKEWSFSLSLNTQWGDTGYVLLIGIAQLSK